MLCGQSPQHEHKYDEREGLDERLRRGKVSSSREPEYGCHAVAGDAHEHNTLETPSGKRGGDRGNAHREHASGLRPCPYEVEVEVIRRDREEGAHQRNDEHYVDAGQVERQRPTLGRGGDLGCREVNNAQGCPVSSRRFDQRRYARLQS